MAYLKLVLATFLVLQVIDSSIGNAQELTQGFYSTSCSDAESIAKKVTEKYVSKDPTLAPALLRMHFHDCFVRGCDASVLLNSTANNPAERDAPPNLSLRGFEVIDTVKAALEFVCPGVVSCADILALAARDAVVAIKGPWWEVPTGRKDGTVSSAFETRGNLPPPFASISQLISVFNSKGLSNQDLVVLSGGHTIGISHCPSFENRLYNFTGNGDSDPTLDQTYIEELKKKCPPGDATTAVDMDPKSSRSFDTDYYTAVNSSKGLFQSDAALLDDSSTSAYVKLQAFSGATFASDFANSMLKMGKIGVLTGSAGEIRHQCSRIN